MAWKVKKEMPSGSAGCTTGNWKPAGSTRLMFSARKPEYLKAISPARFTATASASTRSRQGSERGSISSARK